MYMTVSSHILRLSVGGESGYKARLFLIKFHYSQTQRTFPVIIAMNTNLGLDGLMVGGQFLSVYKAA